MSEWNPSLFVSHGAPTLPLETNGAKAALQEIGRSLPRPEAILCVSAHWETARPRLSTAERPETIHDFFGFPDALYRLGYPAPGAPQLARRAAELIEAAGLTPELDPARGLDHGAWVPLMLLLPEADIPVAQLSVQPAAGPAAHLALGRALAPLREEGVLVLGSGGAIHNLAQFRIDRQTAAPWALAFEEWLVGRAEAGDFAALADFRTQGPSAGLAQPSDEHYLPLLVAAGAGGEGARGKALHRSFAHGSLAMTVLSFG